MKKHLSGIFLVFVFLIGLSVLLYPAISDYWNSKTQSRAIADYADTISNMNTESYEKFFNSAEEYNRKLSELDFPLLHYSKIGGYNETFNINGNGMMGYITISKIGVELPIYHGTSESVLNIAAGHLEGSSLPVGGKGTHSVISAHRGLPSAKLFTRLDKLEVGDTFTVTMLDRVLTYEVDKITVTVPEDTSELGMVRGEDYCTLLTCTPYGINTHRLLVRGVRTETIEEKGIYVSNEAYKIDPLIVTPAVAAPMLLILLIILLVKYRKRRKTDYEEVLSCLKER